MRTVAIRSARDREALFRNTAAKKGSTPILVEK